MIKVLINDSFKKYMLSQPPAYRAKVRQKFEFLEIGYWDGGLNVKKLKSLAGQKAVFEARLDRGNRILFTMGREAGNGASYHSLLVYVWGIVAHDRVSRKSQEILPGNVPFLQFKPYHEEFMDESPLEDLDSTYFTQEGITQKIADDSATQRWHLLNEESWERMLDHREDAFELKLYLTPKQLQVLSQPLPILVSGTAGSGKTTLGVYYLLTLPLAKEKKLFVTYNHYLKETARKLYHGLMNTSPLREEYVDPLFLTFKEYCLQVAERCQRSFAADQEIDFERFSKIILSCPHAKGYDAPLIWEEIRSIIKGALPQINANILKNAPARLKNKPVQPTYLSALQQQFSIFTHLKSLEKAGKFVEKYLQTDILTFSRNLSHYVETQGDRVLTIIDRTFNLLLKARELTQQKHLSFVDYEALGKKKAPNFQLDRHNVYRVFEWYQQKLDDNDLWDELDLTREVLMLLSEHGLDAHRFDLVVCDEVQDLTDVQHELLFYAAKNPMNLLLCGDTKQTINPSGFRWEELKRHFYERELKIPDIHFLNLNFRSSGSIVELSNILLELKSQLLGSHAEEPKEDWKYKGRPPVVVRGLNQPRMLECIQSTSAKKTVLVRTDDEKERLKKCLETELVFTINEAKGLEFETVLLWSFGSDERTKDVWKVILAESDRGVHQAKIKHEINLLYVAITRARRDLIIYDDKEPSLIWDSEPIRDKVYTTDDVNYISSIWNVISTPEEWLEQGHYFFERRYYKAAMECYKNAGEDTLLVKARAYDAEKRQDFQVAAENFEKIGDFDKAASYYEKCDEYQRAFQLWGKSNNKEKAHLCELKILEQEGRFAELADIHLSGKAYQQAFEFLVKAQKYEQAAEVSLKRLKNNEEAAYYYEKGGLFEQAALLYQKLRDFEKAATLFEKARDFDNARKLWRRLKREDRLLSIYQQTGDYSNLLAIYEKSRDFDNAVKVAKKLDSGELLPQAHALFEKRKYFPALVRYYVAKHNQGTAECYFKLRDFYQAARFYDLAEDYYHAAKAYEKLRDMKAAFASYLKSEEDKQNTFPAAKRIARRVRPDDIRDVGQQLRTQQKLEVAEFCFSLAYDHVLASFCALEDNRNEQALDHWRQCLFQPSKMERIANYCLQNDLIRIAAEFFLAESPYSFSHSSFYDYEYRGYGFKLGDESALVILMDKYFEQEPDADKMVKWTEILRRLTYADDLLEKKLLYLEKSQRYNDYFAYLHQLSDETLKPLSQLEEKFNGEYPALVKDTSEISASKLYFLGKFEDFNRIVSQLQLTEHNYRIFAASENYEEAIDMMLARPIEFLETVRILHDKKEFLRLAEIYEKRRFVDDAAKYYGLAKEYGKSALMYEKALNYTRAGEAYYKEENYEKAVEMYLKSGKNKAKIAQAYEKLGEYANAAKIWKELGKPRKYQNCVSKLQGMDLFNEAHL